MRGKGSLTRARLPPVKVLSRKFREMSRNELGKVCWVSKCFVNFVIVPLVEIIAVMKTPKESGNRVLVQTVESFVEKGKRKKKK